MRPAAFRLYGSTAALVTCAVACGSGATSDLDGLTFGDGSRGPLQQAPPTTTQLGADGGGTGAACASASVESKLTPLYLTIMLDVSGSMVASGADDLKWKPISAALQAFFADPLSAGLDASLHYFPTGNSGDSCTAAPYARPDVAMRALPDPSPFAGSLASHVPHDGANTPTVPALSGAIASARQAAHAHPDGKSVVLFVTDGEPNDDCGSDVAGAAAVATGGVNGSPSIPTYVIGVGDGLSLDTIAAAGGTNKAIPVSASMPGQAKDALLHVLETLRGQAACKVPMPAPPPGKPLDLHSVNVVYTATNQPARTLDYDADCKGGGWHYDDPSAPKSIELCSAACGAIHQGAGGRLSVNFGCATQNAGPGGLH